MDLIQKQIVLRWLFSMNLHMHTCFKCFKLNGIQVCHTYLVIILKKV